jgi:hypothetical protein
MLTETIAYIRYYKYALSAILIISIIFLCGDIFGAQDSSTKNNQELYAKLVAKLHE